MVNGALLFEHTIKLPIPDQENKKIIAILTYCEDVTSRLRLHKLLQFYLEFYPKSEAVKRLLEHLKIDSYFHPSDPPTLKEVQILCAMRENDSIKYIARATDTSPTTAANHLSQLRNKLLKPHYLHEIVIQLRSLPTESYQYASFI